eukprot:5633030-Pleurochrysis_carterae.AAC.1
MHDKTLAECPGRLKVIQDQLSALPLSAYDASIFERAQTFSTANKAVLRTPQLTTCVLAQQHHLFHVCCSGTARADEPPPTAAAPTSAPAPEPASAASDNNDDDGFRPIEEVDREVESGNSPRLERRPKANHRRSIRTPRPPASASVIAPAATPEVRNRENNWGYPPDVLVNERTKEPDSQNFRHSA